MLVGVPGEKIKKKKKKKTKKVELWELGKKNPYLNLTDKPICQWKLKIL